MTEKPITIHPIQPLAKDADGVVRFKLNTIVQFLLESGPFDLNDLAGRGFPTEDWRQFAQLIGYSLDGFATLSYADDDTVSAARLMADGIDELTARLNTQQELIDQLRDRIRSLATTAFNIHPDDLHP